MGGRGSPGVRGGHRATSSRSHPLGPSRLATSAPAQGCRRHAGAGMASSSAAPGGGREAGGGTLPGQRTAPLGHGARPRDTRLGGCPCGCHRAGGAGHSRSTAGSGAAPVLPGATVVAALRGPASPVCPRTGGSSRHRAGADPEPRRGAPMGACFAPQAGPDPSPTPRCPPGWGDPAPHIHAGVGGQPRHVARPG